MTDNCDCPSCLVFNRLHAAWEVNESVALSAVELEALMEAVCDMEEKIILLQGMAGVAQREGETLQ